MTVTMEGRLGRLGPKDLPESNSHRDRRQLSSGWPLEGRTLSVDTG